ncbi:DUF2059 domain-containing protein [Pseudoxanthomonas jiangsuensis]|uniref:DUF2059 domain-containing protein n=1 Tax=Pseudoxanthomonas jiangsuensis TaxID=619688 RepID=UPI001391034C|nr:DUF2059 domain-containing protein [Pseudoxanthomonas jiangsuensis]
MPAFRTALALLLATLPLPVLAAPPSDDRLEHLLEVMRVQRDTERMLPQIEAAQEQMVTRALAGDSNVEKQKAVRAALAESRASLQRMLGWERLQPLYMDIYRKTYDGEDVEAMIAFYESPAGQRVLDRQPRLMENVMAAVGELVGPEMIAMGERIATIEKAKAKATE